MVNIKGQEVNYKHYKIGLDLDCSQVYTVFEDSKGLIWLGTNNGVIQYDGVSFKNYTTKDGLASSTVFSIGEFKNGLLWFSSFGTITFLDSTFYCPEHLEASLLNLEKLEIMDVNLSDDSTLVISTYSHGVLQYKNGRLNEANRGNVKGVFLGKKAGENPYVYQDGRRYYLTNYEGEHRNLEIMPVTDSTFLFSVTNTLYAFNTNTTKIEELYKYDKGGILLLTEDKEKNTWLSDKNKGLFQYRSTISKITSFTPEFLIAKRVTGFLQCNEKGYWVTTLGEGVFFLPNPNIKYINNKNIHQHAIKKIISNDTAIFIASKNSYIAKLHKGKINTIADFKCELRDFTFDQNNNLFSSTIESYIFNHTTNKQFNSRLRPRRILFSETNELYGSTHRGLLKIDQENFSYLGAKKVKLNVWSLTVKNENEILISSNNGPWNYNIAQDKFSSLGKKYPTSVGHILSYDNTTIFCTSKGILVKKDENFLKIDQSDGLISNECNHGFISSDSSIWISTNKGLSRIRNVFNPEKREIFSLNIEDGLNSNMIFNVCELNDTIYVATSLGVNYFPKNMPLYAHTYDLYIDSISINKKNKALTSLYELKYNENSIRIDFHAISYKKNIQYKYRVLPQDSLWTVTSDRYIVLSSLLPKNYTVEIGIEDNPNVPSELKRIHFNIDAPIYQKWWFIVLMSLIILTIFYLIFRYRIKQIRTKQQLESDLNDTKQQALSSQMNPHFIFNSLNSIHRFVLTSDKKNSSKYISKFSKLMRSVLDNSRNKLVTIEKEMETLDIYMELEALRFKDKFSYTIGIHPNVKKEILMIPPLLLQPFVENAIWHGIMHKEEKGEIAVSIQEKGNMIVCTIEDDGVGREKAAAIKSNTKIQHKSAGIDITTTRIELAEKLFGKGFSFHIFDLKDKKNNPIGTRVELNVPKISI